MKLVGLALIVCDGLLSLAALSGLQVPWVFSSPSIFAFASILMMVCGIFLVETQRKLGLKVKFAMCSYLFGVLLLFPIIFGFPYEPSSSFLSFGFYRMALLILGVFAIQIGFKAFLHVELPIAVFAIIAPTLMLFLHWFFVPDSSLGEITVIGSILVLGAVLGGLYTWLWVKAAKTM